MSATVGLTIVLLYMVDEDELVALRARLTSFGFQVIPVGSLEESQRALAENEIGCAFVEVRASHLAGLTAIRDLKDSRATAPVVVLSSNQDLSSRIAGRDAGADYYLATPIPNIDLEMTVAEIRKMAQGSVMDPPGVAALEHRNLQLRTDLDEMRMQLVQAQLALREARSVVDSARDVPSIAGGHQPEIDELTALIGPGALQDHLDREYARARRYGHALSVLMLDVDRLGRYDKAYGEDAGDRALRLVADVLRSALRSPDIAARVGGDDFVILATDTTEEQAYLLAERLRAALRAEGQYASQPPITVSIGIASSRRLDVKRAEDLLVAAQYAVSQAKGAGGDQSVIASS